LQRIPGQFGFRGSRKSSQPILPLCPDNKITVILTLLKASFQQLHGLVFLVIFPDITSCFCFSCDYFPTPGISHRIRALQFWFKKFFFRLFSFGSWLGGPKDSHTGKCLNIRWTFRHSPTILFFQTLGILTLFDSKHPGWPIGFWFGDCQLRETANQGPFRGMPLTFPAPFQHSQFDGHRFAKFR